MAISELQPRQQAFVREYLKDFNASKAAVRAGYSKEAAGHTGYRLINHPKIKPLLYKGEQKTEQAVDKWQAEIEKYAYAELSIDDLDHHQKAKYLDMIARAQGRYQDANPAGAMAFQINIHIGDNE